MNLLDLIFPKICYGCGEWGTNLCPHCLNKIKEEKDRICPECGRASISGAVHPKCRKRYGLDGLTTAFIYSGLVKQIIKKLKFRFLYDVSHELVEIMVSSLGEDEQFSQVCRQDPAIIPVPLHPSRRRWRGFNQSELLGKEIAGQLRLNFFPEMLFRNKKTLTQSLLAKKKRLTNVKGAFIVKPVTPHFSSNGEQNCRYILFDDIWTTGATLRECAYVLKQNKAVFVWGLTVAR